MSEYVAAHIYIGGKILRTALPGLLREIHDDGGLRLTHDEELKREQLLTEEDVFKALDAEGHLLLSDPEANMGMFEGLENFCKAWDIEYTRFSDGLLGAYDAEVSFRRAGDDEAATLVTNGNWEPVIEAIIAIRAFRALQVGNTHEALTLLLPYADGYEVPPLPPLQIVDKVE